MLGLEQSAALGAALMVAACGGRTGLEQDPPRPSHGGPTCGTEQCDGLDDDCDGRVDEGVSVTLYPDLDRDGFGDAMSARDACLDRRGSSKAEIATIGASMFLPSRSSSATTRSTTTATATPTASTATAAALRLPRW